MFYEQKGNGDKEAAEASDNLFSVWRGAFEPVKLIKTTQ